MGQEPGRAWTLFGHSTHPDNTERPQTTSVSSAKDQVTALFTNNHYYGLKILGFWVPVPSAGDRPRRVAGVNGA
jgi:hypothetical protein